MSIQSRIRAGLAIVPVVLLTWVLLSTAYPQADKPTTESGQPKTSGAPVDLAEEAKKESHPELKKLLQEFAKPHDVVILEGGAAVKVQPLSNRFDPKGGKGFSAQVIGTDGTETKRFIAFSEIVEVRYYEQRAAAAIRELRKSGLSRPAPDPPVSRYRLLQVLETVLRKVLSQHLSFREQNLRQGDAWKPVEDELRKELILIQVDQVRALAAEKKWQEAESLAAQLYAQHLGHGDLHQAIDSLYVTQANLALEQREYLKARERLEALQNQFTIEPSSAVVLVQSRLRDRALEFVAKSDELAGQGKTSEAILQLQEAERVWPRLPGLRDKMLRLQQNYPVLRVAVRSLPNPAQFLPTTMQSDADRLAVRLMFEKLIQLRAGPSARDGYRYTLGPEQPRFTADGWEFLISPEACWSDGKPLTVDDVIRSFQLLGDGRCPYYDPTAREIMEVTKEDAQRIKVRLARGHLDPLALMTFDLVSTRQFPPGNSARQPAFANPLGSGPYVFKEVVDSEMVFVANPYYRRPHCPEGPSIREVRFIKYDDFQQIRGDLAAGKFHLVLDLRTPDVDGIDVTTNARVVTATEAKDNRKPSLKNPRVYFLAPNYRLPEFQNKDLRHAISWAIDREVILDEVFRGGKNRKYHQALNGPFPIDSWAYKPDLPAGADLFKPDLARGHLKDAQKALRSIRPLSIKHAADDANAGQACQRIAMMLTDSGLQVTAQAVPRAELIKELAKDQPSFDLLYWHYDFETEGLSLWPLFDPEGIAGGRNFTGYTDGDLEGMFQELQSRRDFSYVQSRMQRIHDQLLNKMVLIPLWQLDRHVAVHNSLKTTRLHPLWLFDGIEEWKLDRGP